MKHSLKLLGEGEQHSLVTDPSIPVPTPEGRYQTVIPYRLGMMAMLRRDPGGTVRPYPPQGVVAAQGHTPISHSIPIPGANGTAAAVQHQVKKMPPPTSVPQMRISSNGGMRPVPAVSTLQVTPAAQVSAGSPPHAVAVMQHPTPSVTNGAGRAAINMPHVDALKPDNHVNGGLVNGVAAAAQSDTTGQTQEASTNGSPTRPKSQSQVPVNLTSNYQLASIASYGAALANPAALAQYGQHTGLSRDQVQNLKLAFANLSPQDLAAMQSVVNRPPYMHLQNARNLNVQLNTVGNNLKLPSAQPMQWTASSPLQRPGSVVNGVVNGVDAQTLSSPVSPTSIATPVRTPSANGTRQNGIRAAVMPNGQMSLSPHLSHSPSPLPSTLSQSPPRLPITPTMGMASPSLQHQQPVGNTPSGF